MLARTLCLVPILTLALLSPAQAQNAPEPSRTTAIYGDWIVRCETTKRGEDNARYCEMAQTFSGGNGQGNVAQVVIGRPEGEKMDRLVVELPAGVWLPEGVSLKVSDKDFATLTFKRCPQSCFASTSLTDPQRETLFSATNAAFVFKDAAQKPIAISLSLKGIRDAYKAMSEK